MKVNHQNTVGNSCFRHNGRANTSYADGHVTTEQPAELDLSVLAFYNCGWLSLEPRNYRFTQWQENLPEN